MDGANASTTFTDESGKTWTSVGDAQLVTGTYKFGTACLFLDGTGDKITTPDSDDFTVGSGNFTVDFWMRRYATGISQRIYGQADSAGNTSSISFYGALTATQQVGFYILTGSTYVGYNTTATISDDGWHHIAQVRNGNTMLQFIDGVGSGSYDCTGVTANNSSNLFAIGERGEQTTNHFNGCIDEFRFSKGIARWTSDFTPPTAPYPLMSNISPPMWFM